MSSESEWDGGSEESEEDSSMEEDLEGESSSEEKCVLCGESGRELREVNVNQDLKELFDGDKDPSGGGSDNDQVCESCHLRMKSALAKRKKAAKIECRVRSLQLEILKELKQLDREMGRFYMEMVELERIASRSLDDTKEEFSFGQGMAFRRKIIEAVRDLGLYRDGIAVKLEPCNSPASRDEADEELLSPVYCKMEPEEDSNFEDNNEEPDPPSPEAEEGQFDNEDLTMEPSSPKENPRAFRNSYQNLFRRVQRNSKEYKESEKITQSMPPLQRHLVLHVIRKSIIRKAMGKEGISNRSKKIDGPEFEYDLKSGRIMLEHVEVKINEALKSLHCSLCSHFRMLPEEKSGNFTKWKGLSSMRLHILSTHLNNFKCKICGKILSSNNSLTIHMALRHLDKLPDEKSHRLLGSCEICGKPFVSPKQIEPHKWRHLNAQEKEDAIAKGLGPPPSTAQARNWRDGVPGAGHQCAKCGNRFRWKSSLKTHELNHCSKPPRVRAPPKEKVKAPKKEKKVKPPRRYFCRRGCGRELCDHAGLCRHEKRCDGTGTLQPKDKQSSSSVVGEPETGFVREEIPCWVCGRGMASRASLRGHILTHMSCDERNEAEKNGGVKLPPSYSRKMEGKAKPSKKKALEVPLSGAICSKCGKVFKKQKCLQTHERKFHPE